MALDVSSPRGQRERAIFRATLEELASADYGALSIDSVAKRAGVNKTTIYRRWPTKAELVSGALNALTDEIVCAPSAGSLRADLLEIGRRMRDVAMSLEGQGLARLGVLRAPDPDLADVAEHLRVRRERKLEQLLATALERNELAKGADLPLLLDMLGGLLHVRFFVKGDGVDDLVLVRAVDILLHGAQTASSKLERKNKKRKRARKR